MKQQLTEMFELQYKLQERLGTWGKIEDMNLALTQKEARRQQFVNQMFLAMMEEVVEVMRETSYKNPEFVLFGWKKGQVTHKEKILSEIVDLWHFMMNVCLAYGFTAEDFYNEYLKKNGINHERKENNY